MKNVVKLVNYYSPGELKLKQKTFVQNYNYERYHESLDNLTPDDMYYGRKKYKLDQRKKCKVKTLKMRKQNYIRVSLKSLN